MVCDSIGVRQLPAIAIVQDSSTKLPSDSSVINSFKQIYISATKNVNILLWIQQNQPDLIILNLELSKISELDLVAALRLDWLTRNIPILVTINSHNWATPITENTPISWQTTSRPQGLASESHKTSPLGHNTQPWDCLQVMNLDYDACLVKPYSTLELEKTVCSLVCSPACYSYAS